MAVAAYQALARAAETRVDSVRRTARTAWITVGAMSVAVVIAVGWTTYRITDAGNRTSTLQEELSRAEQAAQAASAQREALQSELSAARQDVARTEGRLSAMTEAQALRDEQAEIEASQIEQAAATEEGAEQPEGERTLLQRMTAIFQD